MDHPEPSLFDENDTDAQARLVARAEADAAAGRVVSNNAMVRWFKSWGTADESPRPKCGE